MAKTSTIDNSSRVIWLDIGRGYLVFLMFLEFIINSFWINPPGFIRFLFFHAMGEPGNFSYTDVGAFGFVLILGVLFSTKFREFKERKGIWYALGTYLYRYGLIVFLGILITFIEWRSIIVFRPDYIKNDGSTLPIFITNTIFNLGIIGITGLPFVMMSWKKKIIIGYVLTLFFALLLYLNPITNMFNYAQTSPYLGIFFTIFCLTAVQLFGSSLGDILIPYEPRTHKKKVQFLLIFSVINLVLGIIFLYQEYLYIISYGLIAIGVVGLHSLVFIYLDIIKHKRVLFLQFLGENPFLIYAALSIPAVTIGYIIGNDYFFDIKFQLVFYLIIIILVMISYILYLKRRKISSSDLFFIIIVTLIPIILIKEFTILI